MAMSFIDRAACNGKRPASLAGLTGFERPHLLGRLAKERGVARFIVAPDGYGKTTLAAGYAETMFGWGHTFWIGAQSPCFIRDLDAGTIAADCLAADRGAALVVIDQLPVLDSQRMQRLSHEIDLLLEADCEVVVTCVPSADAGSAQHDRVRLGAADLLLQDDELDASRTAAECDLQPAPEVPESRRVPALVWGAGTAAAEGFAGQLLREELPCDLMLVVASALVLQKGSAEDLGSLVAVDGDAWDQLRRDYPHLGLGQEREGFDAVPLDIALLAQALKGCFDLLGSRSVPASREGLVQRWADVLLSNGLPDRACETMRLMGARQDRMAWLHRHRRTMMQAACFYQAFLIARDRKGAPAPLRMSLTVLEAACRALLGDAEAALRLAHRCRVDGEASDEVRAVAALVSARFGEGDEAAAAQDDLRRMAQGAGFPDRVPAEPFAQLAALGYAACDGLHALMELWEGLAASHADDAVLCLGAAWAFGAAARESASGDAPLRPFLPRAAEEYVRRRLVAGELPDHFLASAGLAMEDAHRKGVSYNGGALEAAALFALRQAEMSVLAQRHLFASEHRAAQAKRDGWMRTHPAAFLDGPGLLSGAMQQRIPMLNIKLFGCFQVSIGDTPVATARFRRQNARSLLVILAVNQGREVTRDFLIRALWPESEEEAARKNFYTVWSQLRKVLTLPDGTCPYLVRHQFGCSLEQRYVQSDLMRFSEICRELLFGAPEVSQWSSLFAEIDRDFSNDLMPSEHQNRLIVQARNDCRARLVDALVAATGTIVSTGHPEWGIWFARAALRHDQTREDAWVALMQAQIASSQRTAAMMTFLRCRSVLDEQLGIDPSPEASALYAGLLEGEKSAARP